MFPATWLHEGRPELSNKGPSTSWVGEVPVVIHGGAMVGLVVVGKRECLGREGSVLDREKDIKTDGKGKMTAHKVRREKNGSCVRVFIRFTEFLFGLNMSLHSNSELDILVVDLERF